MTPTPTTNASFVSVIIPVYNDGERLRLCLAALAAQTYPASRFEVIVVDNAADESLAELSRAYPWLKLAREPRPGSYAARNTGLSLAVGDVLAFTDADCIPAPDWLEQGGARLSAEANCGLVAGRIRVFFRDPARPTAVELHESLHAFPQHKYVSEARYGATANLFTRRAVFEHVGPFNDQLKSGGDQEWGNRVHAAGYRQVYCEEAAVGHPARRSFRELFRKVTRVTGGHYQLEGRPRYSVLRFLLDLRPPTYIVVKACSDRRLRGVRQRLQFIVVETSIRYFRAWERLRLTRGAAGSR